MAKKNSTFGKFLAFTTAVVAIGGVCYIYRDKIKESETFKKASDKFDTLRNKVSNKFASDEDDFFFDDEFEDDFEDDIFNDTAKNNREYTSITINPKDVIEDDSLSDIAQDVANDVANAVKEKTEAAKDEVKEIFANDSIPTISFGSNQTDNADKEATDEVLGYENEGLSDVDDDPDALSDQDKLDF